MVIGGNGYLGKTVKPLYGRVMPVTSYIITTEPLGEDLARSLIRDNEAVADTKFILDYFRREKVRNTWVTLFGAMGKREGGDEDFDILASYEAEEGSAAAESGADHVERRQTLEIIDAEVQKLPARQREAFLMRYWQDMDVAETAEAMGCSEGSVKTHCSRATHTLAESLKAKGIKL